MSGASIGNESSPARGLARWLFLAVVLSAGCGPLWCVGARHGDESSGAMRCYSAWKGTVRDSLVVRGEEGLFSRHRPLKGEVTGVRFPVLAPEHLPEDIDVETFHGEVIPAGTSRLYKSGRVY